MRPPAAPEGGAPGARQLKPRSRRFGKVLYAVGQNFKTVLGSHFGVGEFTTDFRTILVRIGMFTGGTFWILTHGHIVRWGVGLGRHIC